MRKILSFLLPVFLLLVATNVWADDVYVKVSSTSDLVANGEYILVETSSGTDYLANTTYSSSKYGTVTSGFTISGSNVTVTTGTAALVIKLGGSTGSWTLYDTVNKKYIGKSTSSNTNLIQTTNTSDLTNAEYLWTIKLKGTEYAIYNNYKSGKTDYTTRYIGRNGTATGPYDGNTYPAFVLYKKTAVETHTLSTAVSPAASGSVVAGSTTVGEGLTTSITATPADGYRFVDWSVSGTGSSVASTTSATTTFTMGTANATVTANFEAIPTHTLSYVVDPVGAGTVTLGATSVREGSSTMILAAANSGYEFVGWEISGTGASIEDEYEASTTITMGTANATVTALFDAVTTHAITWSVNGVDIKTENIKEGNSISFDEPASGVPDGYDFKGWVVAANRINTPTNTNPSANYVTSATSTADITYYAVMAVPNVESETATLTASHTEANTTYDDHNYTDDKSNTWSGNTNEPYENSVARIGLRNTSGSYLESPTFSGNITAIAIKTYNGSGSDRYFYINSEKGKSKTGDYGSVTAPKSEQLTTEHAATLSGSDFKKFYIEVSGALGFSYIKVTYEKTTYSDYCTTVNQKEIEVTPDGYATFYDASKKWRLPEGAVAYTGTYDDGELTLIALTGNTTIIPAAEPVVLKAASDITLTETAQSQGTAGSNDLVGAASAITGDDLTAITYPYVLGYRNSTTSFFKFNGSTIPAGKAYLVISNYPDAAPIRFIIEDDNIATSMENTKATAEVVKFFENGQLYILRDGITYDVMGRMIK